MKSIANTPEEYIAGLPEDRRDVMRKLRSTIKDNLPKGFEEIMAYGMISYVVPLTVYEAGYGKNKDPLPFVSIASQKNHIAVYHMGVYSDKDLLQWFTSAYPNYVKTKLDMGKSFFHFQKKLNLAVKTHQTKKVQINIE